MKKNRWWTTDGLRKHRPNEAPCLLQEEVVDSPRIAALKSTDAQIVVQSRDSAIRRRCFGNTLAFALGVRHFVLDQ